MARIEWRFHDIHQRCTSGRGRADRIADHSAPDHAQRPKLLEFPPLRFIQKRHDTNQRRLRLRHLLLLLLRAGAITLLAVALARPSIKLSSRLGSQEAPVAAALIFDAAPHMQYLQDKKTRLDAAREIGQWLLAQLPPESQIAVFDSGMLPRTFDVDRGLSKQRIERLEIVPNPKPLTRIVADAAVVLKKDSNLADKEDLCLHRLVARIMAGGRSKRASKAFSRTGRRLAVPDRRGRD